MTDGGMRRARPAGPPDLRPPGWVSFSRRRPAWRPACSS